MITQRLKEYRGFKLKHSFFMSNNTAGPTDSRSSSPSTGHQSSTGEATTAESPYLEFINQSFSTDQDLSLPERTIANPVLDSVNSESQGHSVKTAPKERTLNKLFKRSSKDTLRSNGSSSPIISAHSAPRALRAATTNPAASNPSLAPTKGHANGSIQPSVGSSSSSLSASATPPTPPKSILKQSRSPASSSVPLHTASVSMRSSTTPQQPQAQQLQEYVHPPPADNLAAFSYPPPPPSTGSSDGQRNSSFFNSTNRSSATGGSGPISSAFDVTQTDLTLEGLAQRWYAYQAMMKKRYSEDPFYRRWTKSKWILLITAIILLGYSCAVFAVSLGYMLGKFDLAPVVMEFHGSLIILSLAGSVFGIVCALIGLVGVFTENRVWLSWYTTLLWPSFALYVSVGYIAFRRAKAHLRDHIKEEWAHSYTRDQRLIVQQNLKCCGYKDWSNHGAYDLRCFPKINLPGCEHKYNKYEENVLTNFWTIAFSVAPLHLFVMISALLCSNHVDGMLRSARPGLKSFKEEKEE
ncbi:hypothetical protein KVV02_007818 [Mortierella alpina]|uniref:Tetraspanin Tsp2 n=1 Tax=Mortierella alpina TaxID=64518 RepID=A0A9P8A378_MORAP|nr:hypothetical protein KVV02_007818 [Mortierella alpina]